MDDWMDALMDGWVEGLYILYFAFSTALFDLRDSMLFCFSIFFFLAASILQPDTFTFNNTPWRRW